MPNSSQRAALSRLFSPGVFRELAEDGRSPLFAQLFAQAGIDAGESPPMVGDAFDAAFEVLRRVGLRDEYVYRSALTSNILLGTHSLKTACMLTEFRAGACKADLVILNGTATAYEIKSERDSLVRLSNQIANYQKVFAKIYVIAAETHVSEVLASTPEAVGVMSLSRRSRISKVRHAADLADHVCPVTILDSLRVEEARAILQAMKVPVPEVSNTRIRGALRELFEELPPRAVHASMVKTLKKTRGLLPLRSLIDQVPASLYPAALSIQLRQADHQRLVEALQTPLHEAMSWV